MYVYRNLKLKLILEFTWKYLIFYAIYGAAVVWFFHYYEHVGVNVSIPFQPISVIGIAVAFYLGFKNNQSYDRFWEARKIWGGIVNYSRTWGNQVLSFVTDLHAPSDISEKDLSLVHHRLIYRHIAWINALRLQLRVPSTFSLSEMKRTNRKMYRGRPGGKDWKQDVAPFLSCQNETDLIEKKVNTATQIIRQQGEDCKNLLSLGLIEDFRHMELMHSLEQFYNFQGKCERIKNTPLPRQYSFFSMVFVWIFVLLLPFGLVGEFHQMGHSFIWLTIPFFMLIAWIFMTMELVGDNSEDPFENFINDVPMTALCRTIEIDLKDMLGETDLPPKLRPVDGVLM